MLIPVREANADGTANAIDRLCVIALEGAGSVGGNSRVVDPAAPPSVPLPKDSIFFRFLHLTRANINNTIKANPATLPITEPTTTEVGGGVESEDDALPAPAVLEGEALVVATPDPPPTPPTAPVVCTDEDELSEVKDDDEVIEDEEEVVEELSGEEEEIEELNVKEEDKEEENEVEEVEEVVEFKRVVESKLLELEINVAIERLLTFHPSPSQLTLLLTSGGIRADGK